MGVREGERKEGGKNGLFDLKYNTFGNIDTV